MRRIPMIHTKKMLQISLLPAFFIIASLSISAQEAVVDREKEKKKFKSLYYSEKIWEKNIKSAYDTLGSFGHLVKLAKNDRALSVLSEKEPLNFNHDKVALRYVPWRSSIRYVKEGERLILNTFGKLEEVKTLIKSKIDLAKMNKINASDLNIGNRDGIELSRFGFIRVKDPDKIRAIGSQRDWLSLFFAPQGNDKKGLIALATLRTEYNNLRAGVKDVQIIIDPSPMDDNFDDIVIISRYNQDTPSVSLVGLMRNDKSFSHRNEFKRRYHKFLRHEFVQIVKRISKYNSITSNELHTKQFKIMDRNIGAY